MHVSSRTRAPWLAPGPCGSGRGHQRHEDASSCRRSGHACCATLACACHRAWKPGKFARLHAMAKLRAGGHRLTHSPGRHEAKYVHAAEKRQLAIHLVDAPAPTTDHTHASSESGEASQRQAASVDTATSSSTSLLNFHHGCRQLVAGNITCHCIYIHMAIKVCT